MFVDVHAHLDDEAFDTDRQEMIKKIEEAGIIVVNAGSDMASSRFSVKLAEEFDFIYACVGIHPHEAKKVEKDYLTELEELAKSPKVIAIGEIGLDYYYGSSEKDAQKKVFREQIELAKSLNLPVVVHDRDAHKDTADILKNIKPERGLMHCYSGSLEMAQEFIEMNFYFSFGGVITFKNAKRPREVAAQLPLDKILLETDCPYLTPEPYRGKRNDPTKIPVIANKLAELHQVSLQEIEEITYANFKKLFGGRYQSY